MKSMMKPKIKIVMFDKDNDVIATSAVTPVPPIIPVYLEAANFGDENNRNNTFTIINGPLDGSSVTYGINTTNDLVRLANLAFGVSDIDAHTKLYFYHNGELCTKYPLNIFPIDPTNETWKQEFLSLNGYFLYNKDGKYLYHPDVTN